MHDIYRTLELVYPLDSCTNNASSIRECIEWQLHGVWSRNSSSKTASPGVIKAAWCVSICAGFSSVGSSSLVRNLAFVGGKIQGLPLNSCQGLSGTPLWSLVIYQFLPNCPTSLNSQHYKNPFKNQGNSYICFFS